MFKAPKGSAVVVVDAEKRILLLLRSRESHWMPLKWGLPGGKIEIGETWLEGARRETKEETTLTLQELNLLSIDDKVVVYACNDWSGTVEIDYEHEDWAWVPREQLVNYDKVPLINELYEMAMIYVEDKKNH